MISWKNGTRKVENLSLLKETRNIIIYCIVKHG